MKLLQLITNFYKLFSQLLISVEHKKSSYGSIFDEETTDFGWSSVGVAVQRQIWVFNPTNSNLVFSAITSSSVNFYCAFIEETVS